MSIVDCNRASMFFPQELTRATLDPYYDSPVILGHVFHSGTHRPENTPSWRTTHQLAGLSRPSP
ncbi:hypothetical protein [Rhodococcus opacus]|uniref:hypothetical protein n=1 Tax=Rhodococcus opacus TaxID=37919 RepID=UPI0012DB5974|nr:hypothetical protein [Rhodococcus opacus]